MNLEMLNIEHSFGANYVLRNLDFQVESGTIHALLGENGAGKSTLMNILGGVLQPDAGRILLNGKEVHFNSPLDALNRKIGFVHQELSLINDLPIYLNLFLGSFHKRANGTLDHVKMRTLAREFLDNLDLHLDVDTYVRDLDPSYKQILEIAREYLREVAILILDEPTSSLNEDGIEQVFRLVRTLQSRGVTTIFISHKLNEVMELCTNYTVLRDGLGIISGRVEDTTADNIASAMVGHEVIPADRIERKDKQTEFILELKGFQDAAGAFEDVDLYVHREEILGVTGLQGDGRSELFQAVFGDRPLKQGEMTWDGQKILFEDTHEAKDHGLAYVPRDRKENSIAEDLSIFLNGTISILENSRNGVWLQEDELKKKFDTMADQLQILMESPDNLMTSLSGGNQQKVVLARWLMTNPKLLILDNPTQGVDVGVKEEIYRLLESLRREGLTVIVLSNEADEIVRLCDRTYVMFHGRIVRCLKSHEINAKEIMRWATGATLSDLSTSEEKN